MNTIQATQASLQFDAQDLRADESPILVEELTIDELAVREEYSSCYTVK